jgi:hypothetical protein
MKQTNNNLALQPGSAVHCSTTKRNGIIVKKWTTYISNTAMYDVLFEDGQVASRMPRHVSPIIICLRQDGVHGND